MTFSSGITFILHLILGGFELSFNEVPQQSLVGVGGVVFILLRDGLGKSMSICLEAL